jgi:hypothetical protein
VCISAMGSPATDPIHSISTLCVHFCNAKKYTCKMTLFVSALPSDIPPYPLIPDEHIDITS